jgi:uncharacterized damage-inducible protein DinB
VWRKKLQKKDNANKINTLFMTTIPLQIAKHLREVYFGGNWSWSNFKDQLNGVNWQEATTQILQFNTIATLFYHSSYYVSTVLRVLQGERLEAKDEYSFNVPPIESEEDWDQLKNKVWADVESFATLIEQLPESRLTEIFVAEKYGNYYRNLHGIIEHSHYHLGQIAILKKFLKENSKSD